MQKFVYCSPSHSNTYSQLLVKSISGRSLVFISVDSGGSFSIAVYVDDVEA